MNDCNKPQTVTKIDYDIKVPLKVAGEQIGCAYCKNNNSCQFYIEVFQDSPAGFKHTIGHRTKTEFIGLLCKHFK